MPPSHNLYRRFFTPAECRDLNQTPWDDLTPEINLLRIVAARFFAVTQRSAPSAASPVDSSHLSALSLSMGCLASLLNSQMQFHLPLAQIEQERAEGLRLARQALGIRPRESYASVGAFPAHPGAGHVSSNLSGSVVMPISPGTGPPPGGAPAG